MVISIADDIAALVERTTTAFLQKSESVLSERPAPGKWSKKEIIGHLCDSAFNNIQRFVRAQYEENPAIQYEQDSWVKLADYNSYTKAEIISLWNLLNKHLCKVLVTMPQEKHSSTCTMMSLGNETKTYTLKWVAEDYLRHMQHHLKKVNEQ